MATLREIVFDCERPAARGLTPETDPVVLVDGPGLLVALGAAVQTEAAGYTILRDPELMSPPGEVRAQP